MFHLFDCLFVVVVLVTIICKNLQTTYEESINTGEDTRSVQKKREKMVSLLSVLDGPEG